MVGEQNCRPVKNGSTVVLQAFPFCVVRKRDFFVTRGNVFRWIAPYLEMYSIF